MSSNFEDDLDMFQKSANGQSNGQQKRQQRQQRRQNGPRVNELPNAPLDVFSSEQFNAEAGFQGDKIRRRFFPDI